MVAPRATGRELYSNTIATWIWAQASLVASLAALPVLTHFLSKSEFGLWTQLLALSALATVADLGMSMVFLRRLADPLNLSKEGDLWAATAFYGTSAALLGAVLLGLCLTPGGILAPFVGRTVHPYVTASAVIASIVVNLGAQPFTLRLLARGRKDLESIFGAGPAVIGTVATAVAAYLYGSALAVAVTYTGVEIAFDIVLVVMVRSSPSFWRAARRRARGGARLWRNLLGESWAVLAIGVVPQLMLLIDAVVVARVVGPVRLAIYAVAVRVASLLPRSLSPFTESLFVSLCRSTATTRDALARQARQLPWLFLTAGMAATCAVFAGGRVALRLAFGSGYQRAEVALTVLLLAEALRCMYMPAVRSLQADQKLGALPRWFILSVLAQAPLAAFATIRWSIVGTAGSLLMGTVLFEAAPVSIMILRRSRAFCPSKSGSLKSLTVAAATGMFAVLLATWQRSTLGEWTVATGLVGTVVFAVLGFKQLWDYLAAARVIPLQADSCAPRRA